MGPPPLSSLRSIQTSIRPNGASIPADRRPVLSLRPLWARQLSVTRGTLRVPCRIGFQPFLSVGSRAREPCGFLAGSASSRFSPLGHEQGNPAGSLQNRLPAVSLRWVTSKANLAGSLQDRLPAVSLRWVTSKANLAGSLQDRLPAVSLRCVTSKANLAGSLEKAHASSIRPRGDATAFGVRVLDELHSGGVTGNALRFFWPVPAPLAVGSPRSHQVRRFS